MGSVKEEGVIGFEDAPTDGGERRRERKVGQSKRSGGFQSMALSYPVIKGIQKRGYKVPTPIQRKTIPLVIEGRDLVAMARTGSGKTACFLIPLFEKLKSHSNTGGVRALILSPTRELALQTLRFLKELGQFTGIRAAVLLGGDSMDSQFEALHNSPDVIVATPGRFLHICVEMELRLNNVQYVVFDEADRLFEMGFGEQLREIVQRLPSSRQTLLFSATLPKVLVEFARAGLSDPVLIRLDVESKLPDTLETAFISCRTEEKPAALLCLLKQVVKKDSLSIVFAATKHHVEYLHCLLEKSGIPNSYIYSDLDPSARKINVAKFQNRKVSVLVVTDIAARGIDIPLLDNVINYNFPAKAKLFVHRVGRCARAGRDGTAFCLVSPDELCYLLDLHLFLGRPLTFAPPGVCASSPSSLGRIPQSLIEQELAEIISWQEDETELGALKKVSENAYMMYVKSRMGASNESVKRAKDLITTNLGEHSFFATKVNDEVARANILAGINSYRPPGTIFEIGLSSNAEVYGIMKKKRKKHKDSIVAYHQKVQEKLEEAKGTSDKPDIHLELSNVEDIGTTFSKVIMGKRRSKGPPGSEATPSKMPRMDKENFIPYKPSDAHTEHGLAVNDFSRDAHSVGLDLTGDTESVLKSGRVKKVWDKKKKKMVGVQETKEGKIKSESGAWISASYKSGRYKQWMEKTKAAASAPCEDSDEETASKGPPKRIPNTRWAKHNVKVAQKKTALLKRPEQILKARDQLEKRRRKHGKKKKGKSRRK